MAQPLDLAGSNLIDFKSVTQRREERELDDMISDLHVDPSRINRVGADAYLLVVDSKAGEIGFTLSTAGLMRLLEIGTICMNQNLRAVLDAIGAP